MEHLLGKRCYGKDKHEVLSSVRSLNCYYDSGIMDKWWTKALMMSVDLKVIRSPTSALPKKIIFAPPGFGGQIKSLNRRKRKIHSILKGVTYSKPREDKQQKNTETQMKEKKNQCSDLNTDNTPVTSKALLKKNQFRSSQEGCSDTRSSAVPPGEQTQGASSPSSQEHCQAEKAEITGLQRANSCLCACS